MSSTSPTNVGIDVSKETLDIAVHETETHWTSKHEFTEFPQLVKSLKALPPTRIIIEAVPKDLPMMHEQLRPVIERLRRTLEGTKGRGKD